MAGKKNDHASEMLVDGKAFAALARKYPELGKLIASGRSVLSEAEKALLRRALGFRQEEVYSEDICDRKSGEVLQSVKRKVVTKEVPPDVRALLFWLKNRSPGRWRETGGDDGEEDAGEPYEFSPEDLEL
ncbi:MAG: hypothetical protein PHS41_12450 [Victivallaceae bacterium]|nr:hypothetical protein [Victivallaceae bacterium]